MKILKTYKILEMIDENPEKMVGKRYKQVGGLIREEFGIGDIAVVTQYHGITSLGAEKFDKIRIDINGFEEWEEVKESVDFMTADFIRAITNGKKLKPEHKIIDQLKDTVDVVINDKRNEYLSKRCTDFKSNEYMYFGDIMLVLSYVSNSKTLLNILLNGKWYIED